jgi:hypothetical protein
MSMSNTYTANTSVTTEHQQSTTPASAVSVEEEGGEEKNTSVTTEHQQSTTPASTVSVEDEGGEEKKLLNFVILDATETTVESEYLRGFANVSCCSSKRKDGSDILQKHLDQADVIGVWHTVFIQDDILNRIPKHVRLLVRFGVGFDNVDILECAKRDIYVCNVPNYGTEEVADSK